MEAKQVSLTTLMDKEYVVCACILMEYCACVLNCFSLFEMLRTVAHLAPQFMGFSRQEYWNGWPCSPPEDLTNPGTELVSLMSPALAGRCFTAIATLETQNGILLSHKKNGILLFAATQMDLDSIILSEISEKDKDTFFLDATYVITRMWNLKGTTS